MKSIEIIHGERKKQELETRQLKSPSEYIYLALISEEVRQTCISGHSNKVKIGTNTTWVLIVNSLSQKHTREQ